MFICNSPYFKNIKNILGLNTGRSTGMEAENIIKYVTQIVLAEIKNLEINSQTIPVGISARHIHLSKEDTEALFGKGHTLKFFKELSQPGQFAAEEILEVVGPKGTIKKVRVLGPEREKTQIEVSLSDARKLGVQPPIRNSGDLDGTPGIILRGPQGELQVSSGVIIAERHVHMTHQEANYFGLTNGEHIRVLVDGKRGGVLDHVTVRVSDAYALDLHIDTDDANAFGLVQGQKVKFEKVEK